jgi:hypothetical protein
MADRHGLQRDLHLARSGIAQDQGFDGQVAAELMADGGTDFARHLSLPEACFAPHWWRGGRPQARFRHSAIRLRRARPVAAAGDLATEQGKRREETWTQSGSMT